MYPKSPANRRRRMHHVNILPGRSLFCCTDPSNHARRANLAIPGCFVWELRARRGARRGEGCRRSACGSLCARRRGAFAGSSHAASSCPRSRARCSCCRARLRVRCARCPRVRCAYIPRRPMRSKRIRFALLNWLALCMRVIPTAPLPRLCCGRSDGIGGGLPHRVAASTRLAACVQPLLARGFITPSTLRPKQRDRVVYRRKRGAVMVFR